MIAFAQGIITKAVVDTGPLLTVLALNYVHAIHAPKVKRDKILTKANEDLLKNPTRQERYLQLFSGIRTILTTSHVIGELQGLQKGRLDLEREDKKQFWSHSMNFLCMKNIDEQLLRLLDMHGREDLREVVCLIGPTDTGLIDLARKEGCVLLTDDERTLAVRAWEEGVDCRLVKNLVL